MNYPVLEIRNYLLKPNMREHFIDYFETNFIPLLEAENMHVLGQFRLIGEPDHYVWMRAYPDMQSRGESLHAFYGGPVWKKHGKLTNSMIVDSDNVHLLRPLDDKLDLTCGQTSKTIAAAFDDSTISLQTGLVAVDFYQANPGQRQTLIDQFQMQVIPAYQKAGIQVRGSFVAEMGKNTFPRHPAFQNEHELVVITAYKSEAVARDQRLKLASLIDKATSGLLSEPPESLLLSPTLHSPIRYQPD